MSFTESVKDRVIREAANELNCAIERRAQKLVDAGVPLDRIYLRAHQWRDAIGFSYSLHVKTDEEMWLDWQSENHGFGTQA